MKADEKISGRKLSADAKAKVVQQIEGKSEKLSEQILYSMFPQAASRVNQERCVTINESTTRRSMNFNKEMKKAPAVLKTRSQAEFAAADTKLRLIIFFQKRSVALITRKTCGRSAASTIY